MHALASRITFICPMRFNSFPMDVQVCTFQVIVRSFVTWSVPVPPPQVGSFNYAMDKIVFKDEFIPTKEDAVRSILDYAINIFPLAEEEKQVIMTTREVFNRI